MEYKYYKNKNNESYAMSEEKYLYLFPESEWKEITEEEYKKLETKYKI